LARWLKLTPTYILYDLPVTTFVMLCNALSESDKTVDPDELVDLLEGSGSQIITGGKQNG